MRFVLILTVVTISLTYMVAKTSYPNHQHLRKAQSLLIAREDARAIEELEAAIATAPKRFETYSEVVVYLLAHRRYHKAIEYARFTLEEATGPEYLSRDLTQYEQKKVLGLLSQALYESGDPASATEVGEKALKLDPEDVVNLNNVGYFYAEANLQLERALELTQKAVAMAPDKGIFVDSLGWVYYKMGRYEEAERELVRAAWLSPQQSEIRYHLGVLYAGWGKPARARIELHKALELNPKHGLARFTLEKLQSTRSTNMHTL